MLITIHNFVTKTEYPADIALLSSPSAETGPIKEDYVVSEEGQHDSKIHWCVHDVHNGPRTVSRGIPVVMKRTQEHALSALTLKVPLVKYSCMRCTVDDSTDVWVSLKFHFQFV